MKQIITDYNITKHRVQIENEKLQLLESWLEDQGFIFYVRESDFWSTVTVENVTDSEADLIDLTIEHL